MKPDSAKRKEECMKFDSVAGVLNPFNEVWCNDKKTESPIQDSTRRN